MMHTHVYEYLHWYDRLLVHEVGQDGLTGCGIHPYSGQDIEDTWFSDHDRDASDVDLCESCGTESDRVEA